MEKNIQIYKIKCYNVINYFENINDVKNKYLYIINKNLKKKSLFYFIK